MLTVIILDVEMENESVTGRHVMAKVSVDPQPSAVWEVHSLQRLSKCIEDKPYVRLRDDLPALVSLARA